jgi:hypothetical protein
MFASKSMKTLLLAGVGGVALTAGAQAGLCTRIPDGAESDIECSGDFTPGSVAVDAFRDVLLDSTFLSNGLETINVTGVLTIDGVVDSTGFFGLGSAVRLSGAPGHAMDGFVNNGSVISDTLGGVQLDSNVTLGSFINNGIIYSSDNFGGGVGLFGDLSGDFINTGSISSDGVGIIVRGMLGGDFINDTGAVIASGDGRFGLEVYNLAGLAGDFINDGDIVGEAGGVLFSNVFGGGDIAGDFLNGRNGFIVSSPVFPGTGVLIQGTLGGDFVNLGFISGGEDGVRIGDGIGGAFYNDGEIFGLGNDGANLTGLAGSFSNDVNGYIEGGDEGVELNAFLGGFVFNYGDIIGQSDTGLQIDHVGLTQLDIVNEGLIFGGLEGLNVSSGADVLIFNEIGGEILADPGTAGSVGLFLDGSESVVFNDGLIAGDLGILGRLGDDNIINNGRIWGTGGVAVDLDDGDDLFYLDTNGGYQGQILGGAGTDEIVFNRRWRTNDMISGFEYLGIGLSGHLIITRSNLSFMEGLNYFGTLDLQRHTFTVGRFFNFGRLTGNAGVNQGTLNGSVNNFGVVIGDDIRITGDLNNAGWISPGGAARVSTLRVDGNFRNRQAGGTQWSGTQFGSDVTLTDPGLLIFTVRGLQTDFIDVGGFARIGGDVVMAGDLTDLLLSRTEHVLLTAAGGASGNPNLLNGPGVLFTPYLRTAGNDMLFGFSLTGGDFCTSMGASNFNDCSAAAAMQNRWETGPSALDAGLLAVNSGALDPQWAMDGASPETSAATARHAASHASLTSRAVSTCVAGVRAGRCSDSEEVGDTVFWLQGASEWGDVLPDGNAVGHDDQVWGLVFGAEKAKDNWGFGGFLSFTGGEVDMYQARGKSNSDSVGGGLYLRYGGENHSLSAIAGLTSVDSDILRYTPSGVAGGSTSGDFAFFRLDAARGWTDADLTWGFAASAEYIDASLDGFDQAGSTIFDYAIEGADFQVADFGLSLFIDRDISKEGGDHRVHFGGSAGVVYAAGDRRSASSASFDGTSYVFEARGPETDEFAGQVDGYIDFTSASGRHSVRFGVDGRVGANETRGGVFGDVRIRF